MVDRDVIHIRSTDGHGLEIGRQGAAWIARLDDNCEGVPVTLGGLKRALTGTSESFVGRANGLAFRVVGQDIRATYWPLEGNPTLMIVDRESMRSAIEQMEADDCIHKTP